MVQFWRFAQLKTLAWACLIEGKMDMLEIVLRSPAMHASYSQLMSVQKVIFCSWALDLSGDNFA